MKITFLCSDENHPVNKYLIQWQQYNCATHEIEIVRKIKDSSGGDILFLISCSEIVGPENRAIYRACLVLHASALPHGRGWNPHIWQIVEGNEEMTLSLLNAEDKVDSGNIWHQIKFSVPKNALWNEINELLFKAEIELINFAVKNINIITPYAQDPNVEPTYYRRRTPDDSRIDPNRSIENQFDQMRICDPVRFPAIFELRGCKYKIILEKIDGESN